MQVSSFHLHLSSDIPGRLMAFYRDTIGLPPAAGMEDFAVVLGPATTIGFGGHSETYGRTKEPSRVLINLFIEDINASQAELEAKGVKFFRDKGVEYWGGIISSFEDPDGNYVQLIQFDPPLAREEHAPATVTA